MYVQYVVGVVVIGGGGGGGVAVFVGGSSSITTTSATSCSLDSLASSRFCAGDRAQQFIMRIVWCCADLSTRFLVEVWCGGVWCVVCGVWCVVCDVLCS